MYGDKPDRTYVRILGLLLLVFIPLLLGGCSGIDISPDGKRVAFPWPRDSTLPPLPDSDSPALDSPLAIMNLDGTGFHYLPNSEGGGAPKWSPTGKHIAYELEGKLKVQSVENFGTDTVEMEGVNGFDWSSRSEVLEIVGWEKEQRLVLWYDLPTHKTIRRLVLAESAGGNMDVHAIPNSMSVIYADGENLMLTSTEQETPIIKGLNLSRYAVAEDGSKVLCSVNSEDATKRLVDLYEYSITDGKLRPLDLPNLFQDVNTGTPSKPRSAEVTCFSPDLSKMIVQVSYEARNTDGSPQVRSFLIDIVTKAVTPIWLKGEEGSFATWSPKGDCFAMWTIVALPGRVAVTLRWFTADASFSLPILTAHDKYVPGTSSKFTGGTH